MHVYVYMHMYVCIYACTYVYVYMYAYMTEYIKIIVLVHENECTHKGGCYDGSKQWW